MKENFQNGFTLIELLVVISIIGTLASIVVASVTSARGKARDAHRKATLKQLQTALELYYNDNNAYPVQASYASSEPGDFPPYSANYIPGLVPTYIAKLPSDPKGGNSTNSVCPGGWKNAFLYISNGTDYKLLSHCAPEGTWTNSDNFYDPGRPTWAWQVSSPGGYAW